MIFRSPVYLLLALLIPLGIWLQRRNKPATFRFSGFSDFDTNRNSFRIIARRALKVFRWVALLLFIAALARPQSVTAEREYESEGIAIMLVLDTSGSMRGLDFQPDNRLAVAKEEIKRFIAGREHDQIGLVVFARQSFTQCPLTLDYDVLIQLLDEVTTGLIKDGTAIGLGIANGVNRLRETKAKSKVIILLTDGANNAGNIDPVTAAEIAKGFGIKIYTVGIGKEGPVPFPVEDPLFGTRYVQVEVEMDEPLLQEIAEATGGLYFRARDEKALAAIYKKIDQLEKTKIEVKEFVNYDELFPYFLFPAILLLCGELVLLNSLFLKIP